jgi:hypothetical protein
VEVIGHLVLSAVSRLGGDRAHGSGRQMEIRPAPAPPLTIDLTLDGVSSV